MGPGDLEKALCELDLPRHPDLMVGLESPDDAGVFRLRDDLAIIQTVDFFTPIVDDPYYFGMIAAANAMSDIYAMGGVPLTAMNIICFPVQNMEISVLREVLRGGLDKIKEAGALLVGGHSVEDEEFKYGLSVTGSVHPEHVISNRGAKKGDMLILTKPIGTGIINTAIKGNLADSKLIGRVTEIMSTLNQAASSEFKGFDISACTDVTGFGLLGHACEMIEDQSVGLKIYLNRIPLIDDVLNFAKMGIIPGGTHRNRDFRKQDLTGDDKTEQAMIDVLFDPQTSGGLLIAVNGDEAQDFLDRLKEKGIKDVSLIGEFVEDHKGMVVLEG
jgi:selenide,water dikinase